MVPISTGPSARFSAELDSPTRQRRRAAAMLRLRSCILTHLLSSHSAAHPISPLHRLLSASASQSPKFAVEQYLVATCGLTGAQALKASAKISHLKSPTNPDAVLAFLAGLGLSSTDVAAVIATDPNFLCTGVERTLAPVVIDLARLGLSHAEIARLVSLAPGHFRCRSIVSNLPYYLSLLGSKENLLHALKRGTYFLSSDLERVTKPNVALLRECGLDASDIAKLCRAMPRMLSTKTERIQAMVACAEGLGVPRGSGMFMRALYAVHFLSKEKITAKVEYLKNTFRWSDAEVRIAVSKAPNVLTKSEESLLRRSEFLISKVGMLPAYIAHRPVMLGYSLEGRLRPRSYAVKFLKEKGLVDQDRDYYTALMLGEKAFVEKFICPHKEAAPHLAEDYAAACRGEVPTRFNFT
uniref:Uncharacterized protein n=3 Tax=Avena sativa TaxID=4498 RepID=A0ACD5ZBX0_AVESA